MSIKKEQLIKEYQDSPFQVGEIVYVKEKLVSIYTAKPDALVYVTIVSIDKEKHECKVIGRESKTLFNIKLSDISYKFVREIGANPFPKKSWQSRIMTFAYSIESILHMVGLDKRQHTMKTELFGDIVIPETLWDPYVSDKNGNKKYYQRSLCWSEKDKQLLIESIYNGINCGKVIIRKRSYEFIENELKKGNTEVAFKDIVDGKQRLNAIMEFVLDMYPDMHGNLFSDLSDNAQHYFLDSMLITYAEMGEATTDEDVIDSFLTLNFTGVPMSEEHINYVKEIQKII